MKVAIFPSPLAGVVWFFSLDLPAFQTHMSLKTLSLDSVLMGKHMDIFLPRHLVCSSWPLRTHFKDRGIMPPCKPFFPVPWRFPQLSLGLPHWTLLQQHFNSSICSCMSAQGPPKMISPWLEPSSGSHSRVLSRAQSRSSEVLTHVGLESYQVISHHVLLPSLC